ncbi:MAG: PLP-dependent aminotransferase family protein [Clostridia bacterium]|nr:PLP-dependent aminotransferase family protein [Clostridia bacterium]
MRNTKTGKTDKPAYLHLYETLRTDISDGVYPFGSKLPSKRTICDKAGVSVITAEHAYALLAEEGYIEPRERSGYFVTYRDPDFQGHGPVHTPVQPISLHTAPHLSSGTFPFSVITRTMRRVMADYGEQILVKAPNHGSPVLCSAISAYLARSQGIHAEPERIIIGAGAEYLYSLIAQLFTGRRFAVETPCYEKIPRVYRACGLEPETLRLTSGGIPAEELSGSFASVLHTTPFHSFPSGATADVSKRMEYIRWAEERSGYIIEDNYDSELTVSKKNEETVFSMCKSDRVIYLNTFSKTVAPSLRVGYMVLPRTLTETFDARLGFYSCTVPLFEQYVLAELLNSGDFERHINRVRRNKRKELQK